MRTSPSSPPLAFVRGVVRRHRRALAAGLAALALVLVVRDARPPAPPSVAVVVASHEVAAGAVLGYDDVRMTRVASSAAPAGALHEPPVGRTSALPIRSGEVVTDVRVLGPGLLDAVGPGHVAAPVRLADAGAAAVLRPGDVVDVLAAGENGGATIAASATVLVTPPSRTSSVFGSGGSDSGGAVVVFAVTDAEGVALAGAAATQRLSVVVRASPPR